MTTGKLFSKIDLWSSDANRWIRVLAALVLISICITLVCVWLLSMFGFIANPLPQNIIVLSQCVALIFLISIETFYISVKYLQDIYEIPSARNTAKYLWSAVFGVCLPKLKISGGKKDAIEGFNSIGLIGGPGILQIERDNVVALETLQTQKNVLVAGERRITRFDFIKDIFSTEEQYGEIKEIKALTADGIRVSIHDVQFRFRIDGSFKQPENNVQTRDYIPSKKAVTHLAYHRPVSADGVSPLWTDAISGIVVSIIRKHVNNAYLDDLVAPQNTEGHSLDALRNKFSSSQARDQFKNAGAKLDSCNIGEISVDSIDIDTERLKAWFAKQSGVIKVIRAQGDAESFASHERGRTEGQAMLLKSISNALQDIGIDGSDAASVKKNLRNILLTRTAQILESRTSVYHTHTEEDDRYDAHKG